MTCFLVPLWSQEVPDNAVWTSPKETFWLGDHNVSLKCEFKGTPFAVYWMKGKYDYGQAILPINDLPTNITT